MYISLGSPPSRGPWRFPFAMASWPLEGDGFEGALLERCLEGLDVRGFLKKQKEIMFLLESRVVFWGFKFIVPFEEVRNQCHSVFLKKDIFMCLFMIGVLKAANLMDFREPPFLKNGLTRRSALRVYLTPAWHPRIWPRPGRTSQNPGRPRVRWRRPGVPKGQTKTPCSTGRIATASVFLTNQVRSVRSFKVCCLGT